jgi:hypothetical protein
VANLLVDDNDLVRDYEGFWHRVSSNEKPSAKHVLPL